MKKNIITAITAVLMSAALFSCSDNSDSSSYEKSISDSSLSESEIDPASDEHNDGENDDASSSEPENHEIQRNIQPAEGTYVYDYAGVLSAEDASECNDYVGWLYETFLINAAVVITNDIEGMTPAQYAEDAYIELYGGRGSGLLLLVNNDTNEDHLYKTGSCLVSIPEENQFNEFYYATNEIMNGDYKSAVLRIMKLGENCPQNIFDNGGIFTAEQISALEEICSVSSPDISILATSNTTEKSNEEICRSYYDRHYRNGDGIMIMLDTESKTLTIISDDNSLEDLNASIEAANALAVTGDYIGSLNSIITSLKG